MSWSAPGPRGPTEPQGGGGERQDPPASVFPLPDPPAAGRPAQPVPEPARYTPLGGRARAARTALFLRWFYAAYGNLPLLSAGSPRFKRGWAIGAWFVPILNLFRPKQIANDIWRGSDPQLSPGASPDWSGGSLPGLYALWWGGWIVDTRTTRRQEERAAALSSGAAPEPSGQSDSGR